MGDSAAWHQILYSSHTQTLSLPLPLLFRPSSPLREVPITTAAAPHPVSIHTQPSRPIRGLIAYNCVSETYSSVCVCVSLWRCHFVKSQGVAPPPAARCLSPECEWQFTRREAIVAVRPDWFLMLFTFRARRNQYVIFVCLCECVCLLKTPQHTHSISGGKVNFYVSS